MTEVAALVVCPGRSGFDPFVATVRQSVAVAVFRSSPMSSEVSSEHIHSAPREPKDSHSRSGQEARSTRWCRGDRELSVNQLVVLERAGLQFHYLSSGDKVRGTLHVRANAFRLDISRLSAEVAMVVKRATFELGCWLRWATVRRLSSSYWPSATRV